MPDASFYEAAKMILERLGYQVGKENVNFLVAWMIKEKGDYPGAAWQWNNPLNTKLACCNGWNATIYGVKAYPTKEDGIEATVRTLTNGLYPNIINALSANDRGALTSDAVKYDLCVWVRGPRGDINACLYSPDWKDRYADHVISRYLSLGPPPEWVLQGGGEAIPIPTVALPAVALWLGLLGSVLIAVGLALRR